MNAFNLAALQLRRERRAIDIDAVIERAKTISNFMARNKVKAERILAGVPYSREADGRIIMAA